MKKNSPPLAPPSNGIHDHGWGADASAYSRPLAPLLAGFILGILWGDSAPGNAAWAWGAAAAAFIATVTGLIASRHIRFTPIFLFLALGYLSIQHWAAPEFPDHHIHRFTNQYLHQVCGRVIDEPRKTGRRVRFTLSAVSKGKTAEPLFGKIRVSIWHSDAEIQIGDELTLSGKVRPIRSFKNPGGFDYERFMAHQGIYAAMHVQSHAWQRIGRTAPLFYERWRLRIKENIDASADGPSAAILKALMIGDRSGITDDLRDRFSRSGIAHLLAISGLHIGIVAMVAFGVLLQLFAWVNPLLLNGWLRRATAIGCLVPVMGYGLISGLSPATQRALVMTVVVLAACVGHRKADPVNLLILAGLAILIWYPPLLFSVSFQLSFAAVATIIAGMTVFQQRFRMSPKGWQHRVAGFMAVTAFAILGTLPLVMRYFNQISFTGLVANLIFVPLIGFAAVPVGLAGAFLTPVWQSGASGCFHVGAGLIQLGISILPAFSEFAAGGIRTFTPTWIEIFGYYGTGVLILALYLFRDQETATPMMRKGLRYLLVGLCVAVSVDVLYWQHRRFGHDDLRVTVLDVGHGSSTLVEFPGGETMLIDGGGFYDNNIFDVGKRIIAPFLWHKRIMTLDSVVLTHADSDHLNGLLFVLRNFKVKEAFYNGLPKETDGYREFLRIIAEKAIPLSVPEPQTRMVGDVAVTLLHPSSEFRNTYGSNEEQNDLSLVYRIERGDQSVLLPADIEAFAESVLVAKYGDALKSTVMVAPHHGCKTSSTEAFLDHVDPDVVVVSAAGHARFKCPHSLVLERYLDRHIKFIRTDIDGAMEIKVYDALLIVIGKGSDV